MIMVVGAGTYETVIVITQTHLQYIQMLYLEIGTTVHWVH